MRNGIMMAYRAVATALFLTGVFTRDILIVAIAYMTLSLHDAIRSNSK